TKRVLIQQSALEASQLVKIDKGYSARSVKDIAFGRYTYLLGKNQYIHFIVAPGKMAGYFYEKDHGDYFEFKCDLETGAATKDTSLYDEEYKSVLQILTYVELAEIEVTVIPPRKDNGKTRKEGKVLNGHTYTVYV